MSRIPNNETLAQRQHRYRDTTNVGLAALIREGDDVQEIFRSTAYKLIGTEPGRKLFMELILNYDVNMENISAPLTINSGTFLEVSVLNMLLMRDMEMSGGCGIHRQLFDFVLQQGASTIIDRNCFISFDENVIMVSIGKLLYKYGAALPWLGESLECSLKDFDKIIRRRFDHVFLKPALRYCTQCDVNALCGESKPKPPLTLAIEENLESIVSILLDHPRIDPTCAHVDITSTPFCAMVHSHCDPALVEKLMNHPKFDLDALSTNEQAYHKLLQDALTVILNDMKKTGVANFPIWYQLIKRSYNTNKSFARMNKALNDVIFKTFNENRQSVFMRVCMYKCPFSLFLDLVQSYPAAPEDQLRLILSHKDDKDCNVIWYAIAYGCLDICEYFITNGILKSILPDKNGKLPFLSLLVQHGPTKDNDKLLLKLFKHCPVTPENAHIAILSLLRRMRQSIDDVTLQSLLDLTQSDGITPLFDVNKLIPFPNIIHGPQGLSVSEYDLSHMDRCSGSEFTEYYLRYEVMTSIAILYVAMKPDSCRWLLDNPKYQVNLNQCDGLGNSILHYATQSLALTKYLFEQRAQDITNWNPVNVNGSTPLHVCRTPEIIEYLAESPLVDLNMINWNGDTCLHKLITSSAYGHLAIAALANGAKKRLAQLKDNNSIVTEQDELMIFDPNIKDKKKQSAIVASLYVFHSNMFEFTKFLSVICQIPNIHIDETDEKGKTLLFLLVEWVAERVNTHLSIYDIICNSLKILVVDHGADVNRRCGVKMDTPLIVAARRNDMNIATYLVEQLGALVDIKNAIGETALMAAQDKPQMTELLLRHLKSHD